MRQQTVFAVALAALLATAGVGAAAFAVASNGNSTPGTPADDGDSGSTVEVGATGTAEASPNQAVLRVAVTATGDSAAAVRDRLSANASDMRQALSEAGLEDDQIRSTRFDISPNYRHEENPKAPKYEGVHSFEITVENVSNVGRYIDVAVDNGASRVENVRFTLSEDRRSELRTQALKNAMDEADGQAETLATKADLDLAGVAHVSTVERSYQPVRYQAVAMAADAGGGGTSVESGPVTVRVQVHVVYNASEA